MPKEAIKRGAADRVLALTDISGEALQMIVRIGDHAAG
jgi:hypothetical protein